MAKLPDDIETLRAVAMAARAMAEASAALLLAARLENKKLRRTLYGQRSERTARLQGQLELEFEEAETTASQDELAAELAAAKTTTFQAFTRVRPSRKPFPEHLPREHVVVRGCIQHEGEVVHLVAHRLESLSGLLATVGDREAVFPLPKSRGDEFRHGYSSVPDPRGAPPRGLKPRDLYEPDNHIDTI